MATLRIQIQGPPREIALSTLVSTLDNSLRILSELDSAISGEPAGSLNWYITDLSMGSIAVDLQTSSRLPNKDVGPEVASAFVTGLENIELGDESPPYLSEVGMRRAQQLVNVVHQNGARSLIATDFQKTVEISEQSRVNIQQFIKVGRSSPGSVEGTLETISIHGRTPRFIVYTRKRKGVTCKFEPSQLDRIIAALGRRVNASGLVRYNVKGEPLRVELRDLRVLRTEEELPKTRELTGSDPNFTGNLSTEEFIRSVRGG